MARYIDADEALKFIRETNANYHWLLSQYSASWIYDFIESQPVADVVPKSEYDKLKSQFNALDHECDRLETAESNRHDAIEQAKSEVARKKTTIGRCRHSICPEAKAEVAREIFSEIEREFCGAYWYKGYTIERYIAELKKKYTEDQHDSD